MENIYIYIYSMSGEREEEDRCGTSTIINIMLYSPHMHLIIIIINQHHYSCLQCRTQQVKHTSTLQCGDRTSCFKACAS